MKYSICIFKLSQVTITLNSVTKVSDMLSVLISDNNIKFLNNAFQREVNEVIFSYMDCTESSEASSLQELVKQRSYAFYLEATTLVVKL